MGSLIEHNTRLVQRYLQDYGIVHAYDQNEWRPWTGNGYIKTWYEVHFIEAVTTVLNGRTFHYKKDQKLSHQWPNAGKIANCEGNPNILVKLSDTAP